MAKKVTAARPSQSQPQWQKEVCDTCRFSEWITDDHRHRDLNGKPICLRCPNYPHYIVRGRRACNKWKKGVRNEQRTIIADVRRNPATTGFAC